MNKNISITNNEPSNPTPYSRNYHIVNIENEEITRVFNEIKHLHIQLPDEKIFIPIDIDGTSQERCDVSVLSMEEFEKYTVYILEDKHQVFGYNDSDGAYGILQRKILINKYKN